MVKFTVSLIALSSVHRFAFPTILTITISQISNLNNRCQQMQGVYKMSIVITL